MNQQMITGVTGIILAGGGSRRMGNDKSFVPFSGTPLIEHVIDRMTPLFEDVVIVTNRPESYGAYPVRVAPDTVAGAGPLGGIYTALTVAREQHCFVVGCDMPFVHPYLVRYLTARADGYDIVIPRVRDRLQTLCAVYSSSVAKVIEEQLGRGRLAVADVIPRVESHIVCGEELSRVDPRGLSFININTPSDVARYEIHLASPAVSQPTQAP